MTLAALLYAIHALAAVVWVGGMVFAYAVLRPVAGNLQPPDRLVLWNGVFRRFFVWVWHAVVLLPLTGYLIMFGTMDGFAGAGLHVHLMQGLAWIMIAIYLYLFFVPYQRFRAAVGAEDWPVAAGHLAAIRKTVAANMILGLITVLVGSSGQFWG